MLILPSASSDGSSFGKNALLIGSTADDIHHQSAYFSSTNGSISNLPPTIASGTAIGYREVLFRNNTHIAVRITEFYPVAGRIWFNFYNVSAWGGWKVISPS